MKTIRSNSQEAQWIFKGGNILEGRHNDKTMTGAEIEAEVKLFRNWKLYRLEERSHRLVFFNGTTIDFQTL